MMARWSGSTAPSMGGSGGDASPLTRFISPPQPVVRKRRRRRTLRSSPRRKVEDTSRGSRGSCARESVLSTKVREVPSSPGYGLRQPGLRGQLGTRPGTAASGPHMEWCSVPTVSLRVVEEAVEASGVRERRTTAVPYRSAAGAGSGIGQPPLWTTGAGGPPRGGSWRPRKASRLNARLGDGRTRKDKPGRPPSRRGSGGAGRHRTPLPRLRTRPEPPRRGGPIRWEGGFGDRHSPGQAGVSVVGREFRAVDSSERPTYLPSTPPGAGMIPPPGSDQVVPTGKRHRRCFREAALTPAPAMSGPAAVIGPSGRMGPYGWSRAPRCGLGTSQPASLPGATLPGSGALEAGARPGGKTGRMPLHGAGSHGGSPSTIRRLNGEH